MTTPAILPCPCGCVVEARAVFHDEDNPWWRVECACGVCGPRQILKLWAIEAWNHIAALAALYPNHNPNPKDPQ